MNTRPRERLFQGSSPGTGGILQSVNVPGCNQPTRGKRADVNSFERWVGILRCQSLLPWSPNRCWDPRPIANSTLRSVFRVNRPLLVLTTLLLCAGCSPERQPALPGVNAETILSRVTQRYSTMPSLCTSGTVSTDEPFDREILRTIRTRRIASQFDLLFERDRRFVLSFTSDRGSDSVIRWQRGVRPGLRHRGREHSFEELTNALSYASSITAGLTADLQILLPSGKAPLSSLRAPIRVEDEKCPDHDCAVVEGTWKDRDRYRIAVDDEYEIQWIRRSRSLGDGARRTIIIRFRDAAPCTGASATRKG